MHVQSVDIENVRSIASLAWEVRAEQAVGWHVILGDNGSGKSSVLRSVALALVGPEDVGGLRQSGEDWLRKGTQEGGIGLVFARDPDYDQLVGAGREPNAYGSYVRLAWAQGSTENVASMPGYPVTVTTPPYVSLGIDESRAVRGKSANRTVWNPTATGWFAVGFGPFRRFTGGETDGRRLAEKQPRLARYLSLFDERFALSDSLDWLRELKFGAVAGTDGGLFDRVRAFINQEGFLTNGVRLHDVETPPSKRIVFVDGADAHVPIEELSDGFRSILSLTLELLRHLSVAFGPSRLFDASGASVQVPGVVLIDEVDAHLHPTWQRRIGSWFTKAFPRVQFLVTTHSPLVCRSAEKGTIFVLPVPGKAGTGRFLEGQEKARLVYGNLLDAYGTGAFGAGLDRSDAGRVKLDRLAELNAQELERELTEVEAGERAELRAILPSSASAIGKLGS